MFLSVCHTIIIDGKKGTYNAASPDELALVNFAKQYGFEFKGYDQQDRMTVLVKKTGRLHKYELLHVCEFTRTRKRMSVIVKDESGKIIVMCKGADSVVYEKLSQQSIASNVYKETQKNVNVCAEEGLRTLFLAERVVSEAEFGPWYQKAQDAKLAIEGREEKVAAVDELIEVEMELVGSTAIEDRLQDEVADTIQFMKKTGIKVWVLTGDKIETAMNIGVSAGLLDSSMGQHIIDQTDN